MKQPHLIYSLPYQPDTSLLFARFSAEPWAILLDSGQPKSQYGRFDIIVAEPFATLTTREALAGESDAKIVTEIEQAGELTMSSDDPFSILNTLMKPYLADNLLENTKATGLPFSGGAVGYWGYDLARQVERLPNIAQPNKAIPHMKIGLYDWAVVVDHREKTTTLVSNALQESTRENWASICRKFTDPVHVNSERRNFSVTSEVTSNMDYHYYSKAFNKIKAYIKDGDCYQVNLAQRFAATAKGDAWQAYRKLREISAAPFMAYMNFGDFKVLSGSPERFLQVVGTHVETRPIKGTRPRDADPIVDAQYAKDLQSSTKDRAENLMIVDLLRNDISKNCKTGSVEADHLFRLQSFANVHHLVSIVTGTLAKGKTAIDLLRGCFPGGSITGAPKLRAMEIIEELEPHRRGVYCGSVGYIGFDGNMDTNITIRTAVYSEGEISFYAGGGIVADSELDKEYEETHDKASSIMKVMRFFQ